VISDAIAKANADADKRRPEFEQRLASIGAEITRAEQPLSATTKPSSKARSQPNAAMTD
jgi:hypothetical protein